MSKEGSIIQLYQQTVVITSICHLKGSPQLFQVLYKYTAIKICGQNSNSNAFESVMYGILRTEIFVCTLYQVTDHKYLVLLQIQVQLFRQKRNYKVPLQNENVSTLDLYKNSHFYKLNISFSTNSMSK